MIDHGLLMGSALWLPSAIELTRPTVLSTNCTETELIVSGKDYAEPTTTTRWRRIVAAAPNGRITSRS